MESLGLIIFFGFRVLLQHKKLVKNQ